jgi:hypothetical protein
LTRYLDPYTQFGEIDPFFWIVTFFFTHEVKRSAALELSFFVSHSIWLLRTRRLRKRARERNLSYDHFPEAVEWQARGIQSRISGNI